MPCKPTSRTGTTESLGEIEDDGFGDYTIGRHCWELGDVEVFHPAIPAKGMQGWWTWESTSPEQVTTTT